MQNDFRERAAISIFNALGGDFARAAQSAQSLAKACCAAWGHDLSIGEAMANARCPRCGFDPNQPEADR